MLKVDTKEIINEIKEITKIKKYQMQGVYPLQDLDHRAFELLLYQLADQFKSQGSFLSLNYDNCGLMAGTREKGRDIVLSENSSVVGVIQCKRYQKNLTKKQLFKEIIKFLCHYIEDKSLIPDINKFTYAFAVAKGFSNDAIDFIHNRKTILNENLEDYIKNCLEENKTIKIKMTSSLKQEISKLLMLLNIKLLLPTDITNLISQKGVVRDQFFEIEKVIDRKTFEEIIHGENLNVEKFFADYGKAIINNHSRINFFGLALPRKPREVQLYSLFVEPKLKIRNDIEKQSFFNKEIESIYLENNHELFHIWQAKKLIVSKRMIKQHNKIPVEKFEKAILELAARINNVSTGTIDTPGEPYRSISFRELFNDVGKKNMVILGKPGAGKSSLIKYTLCKFIDKDDRIFENTEIYEKIPFRIELNKYNKAKMQHSYGLIEYLANTLERDYQLHYVSKKSLIDLFNKYKTIIFFDGLDEILDVHERIEVRNDIENFLANNINVFGLVTSRYESYEEVYFKKSNFKVLEVSDFSNSQINAYVNKWYSLEEDEEAQRKKEIKEFLEELKKIEDELKTNPLLLTLILILYRNELELPTSKLELYESCTKTLVETRDIKEKKMNLALQISNKIATFSSLGYWQYTNMDSNHQNITYELSQKHIKDYLIKKGEFEFEDEAYEAADEFLEFAKVRSIYVENAFTHKTFLEYFTANYIYTNTHAKSNFFERDNIISKYMGKSSWKVVLELLICRIDKEQSDFEVIDSIVFKHLNEPKGLIFFLQILKYLRNVSPKMIEEIFKKALSYLILNYETVPFNEVKQINYYLINLFKIERFIKKKNSVLEQTLEELKEEEDYKYYYLFILENGISFDFLNNKNKLNEIVDKDPLLFILFNSHGLLTEEEYYKLMKIFLSKFGNYNTLKTYKPSFGNTIFNGQQDFNWILTGLLSQKKYGSFIKNVNNLLNVGISYKQIKKAIYNHSGEIAISQVELESFLKQKNSEPIRQIILNCLRHYYNVNINDKKLNSHPFYKGVVKKQD
ncbi:NACHT domain-containing protein [Priestia sp. HNGD-A6]|uniref:NACHT domain-containing protein n=1 Tax=Priestia sp. HNGD-A6 TaxID=3092666 RepID=UPI0038928B59